MIMQLRVDLFCICVPRAHGLHSAAIFWRLVAPVPDAPCVGLEFALGGWGGGTGERVALFAFG
jgi:hypothetical protein